ncbi:MAG TPA: Gfo/Idh/MocA family oxidoreductase [bacterium]|nr:MAG: putative 4,5-dihydroxyphthalate dehydrogenase [bacterium ADurb.Bin236]HPI78241.1 Gfo/Idh/MocA family oxidoreductase [bacterium]HPN95768.1 Gfo/Idh/MocA family oxidoreductase [bacterium]
MRLGVIGVGKMGINHVKIFSQMRDVSLVGIADVNETMVKDVAGEYGTTPYVDYRDLLDQNLDAVSIVVPTTLHRRVAVDSLNANCHVLVEKPVAATLEEGKEMIALARKLNKKLLVGHVERFNPAVGILKELIDDGVLGNIVSVSSKRVGPYCPRITDCGIILDLSPHDIDVISYLYNDRVREVYSVAGATFHSQEDHAMLMLKFRRGNAGVIETSWLPPHRVRRLNVVGDSGVATLDFIEQKVMVYDKNWAREANVDRKEPLRNELRYFVNLIANNEQPFVSGEDSLHALSVALTAIESYKSGRVLRVPLPDIAETETGKVVNPFRVVGG